MVALRQAIAVGICVHCSRRRSSRHRQGRCSSSMGYQLDFGVLVEYSGLLLKGVGVTLGLTAIAATLGIALSIGGAATARSRLNWVRAAVALYVELIRNTPFIVQLFFIFFGL